MKKRSIVNFGRILYVLLSISSFGVYAQTASRPVSKIPGWEGNLPKPFKSEVQQRIMNAQGRTGPQYYEKMYGVKSDFIKREGATLRTLIDCSQLTCDLSSLPVTLLSFNGERINANEVALAWETTSETNNAGFDIERSLTTPVNFEKVGFVDGNGNSANVKTYRLTDRNSSENVSYYRLKQLDFDGKFEYSRIVAVKGFKELLSLVPTPNPGSQSSGFLQVKGNDKSGKLQLTIVDVKGTVVYKNDQLVLDNSKKILLSRLPELAWGMYIAKIVSGEQHSTVTFVIAER
ncbi:T9SS type A sorting domain-containing protein [Dyadobacter pollutisoli]|uniref:T9SS type A sorting domain-containing protein n=1 Tax=Dyadobacter pollutisoli TaxID=2910158 RepID=A0A9E8NCT5_9BACT|nr:T9SS type A sorting domain-containing protein [Dyadobacter pollutisoli]WAC12637.1 T9SS type A sorting domain-containing protein [Dyadobacter pollutisoli]